MRVIAVPNYGPIDQLQVMDVPLLPLARDRVRVRVHAAAVNPTDFVISTGHKKFLHGRKLPLVMGNDFSGVIEQVGEDIDDWKVGDAVFGMLDYSRKTQQGAFAELVDVRAPSLAHKPANVSHEIAAATTTAAFTALQALRDRGRLGAEQRALILGAAGGVGSLAVGIAHKLGATVTAVCSGYAVDLVRSLGAANVIDRRKQDFLREAPGRFDVIFDTAGAYSWTQTKHLLTPRGRYVTTLLGAPLARDLAVSLFGRRKAALVLVQPVAADGALISRWLGEGLQVPLDSTVPIKALRAALEKQQAGGVLGRIAVQVLGGFD